MAEPPDDLLDLGGDEPLTLRDRKATLIAASEALYSFAKAQVEGSERATRLLLLSGYVMGAAHLFPQQPD